MAAKVATPATMTMGMKDQNAVGTARKSRAPVTLFATVCGKTHFLYITNAEIWLMTLVATITPPKIHNHFGNAKAGINLKQQHITKAKSAKLSSIAPILLSHPSFRAR